MKRLLFPALLCLFSCSVFGQNAFRILQKGTKAVPRVNSVVVERTLLAPKNLTPLAREATWLRCSGRCPSPQKIPPNYVAFVSKISVPRLSNPNMLYGGYNYLRLLAKISREPNTVEPAYARMWRRINNVNTYRGAHHIVNKSTLKVIFDDMKAKARRTGKPLTVNLDEMQHNAPGIFHPLHGNAAYQYIFHNSQRQLEMYYNGGIKEVLDDFFERLSQVSQDSGGEIPEVPSSVIEGTYIEAELWCKTFHLRWE